TAFFVSALTLHLLCTNGRLPVNVPNERSLHYAPVPRGGGLSIWAGCGCAALPWTSLPDWIGPLVALIVVSWLDDRFQLDVVVRLVAQLLAAEYWVWISGP